MIDEKLSYSYNNRWSPSNTQSPPDRPPFKEKKNESNKSFQLKKFA